MFVHGYFEGHSCKLKSLPFIKDHSNTDFSSAGSSFNPFKIKTKKLRYLDRAFKMK